MMKVAVIGAGKMGLPLACQLASRGAEVVACDINQALVDLINAGKLPFEEPGLGELLKQEVASGGLRASTDLPSVLPTVDTIITLIPVMLTSDRWADLSGIEAVTRTIAEHLVPGQMISYETTLPVGTTRCHLQPILESTGYRAGKDFELVFSPERVKSRLVLKHLVTVPKIVGGVDPASARRGEEFYRAYLGAPILNVGTLEAAEFAKLAGMVYRDVNIALANELAAYAESSGLDFQAVIAAANTDGESALLTPGIGVGGHCTPVYPYFALQGAAKRGVTLGLTAEARRINDHQAARLLDRVAAGGVALAGNNLLILGLGFRPGVKEHALSSAFLIQQEAVRRGANVVLHDPLYTPPEIEAHHFTPFDLNADIWPPIVVLNTGHTEYSNLDFARLRERGVKVIVDGRRFWKSAKVYDAGLLYLAAGLSQSVGMSTNGRSH